MDKKLALCFATVCHIMVILSCKRKQSPLVSDFVSCVDENNAVRQSSKRDKNGNRYPYDTTTISNILLGKDFLSIRSSIIENIDINSAAKLFDERMNKYFPRNDIPLLMLSILEIIKKDEYIKGNFCEAFGNYFDNDTYDYPEFMIRILLYTVNNKISSKDELKLVDTIKNDYKGAIKNIDEDSVENVYKSLFKDVKEKYTEGTYTWDANQNKLTINDRSKLLQYSSLEAQKENFDIGDTQSYPQNIVQATISIPPKYKKCHFCKGYVPCGAMKGKCKYNGDKAVEAENNSCEFFDEDRNTVIEYIRSKGVF